MLSNDPINHITFHFIHFETTLEKRMVDRLSFLLLLAAMSGWCQCPTTAFTSSSSPSNGHLKRRRSSSSSSTRLHDKEEGYSNEKHNNNNNNDEENLKKRQHMAVVRSLQNSFYASQQKAAPSIDKQTGMIHELPLWRVPWTEVPGRSNVLNVHDPMDTNMFETILHGPKPWCFGHLYQSTSTTEPGYRFSTWDDMNTNDFVVNVNDNVNDNVDSTEDKEQQQQQQQHSATIGCLMKISDYRRMADGRLLLLVHAMERFVTTNIHQVLPYSIASVQLLPDSEEIDPDIEWMFTCNEQEIKVARAMAIDESIRFHDYEYDPEHKLPCPPDSTTTGTTADGSLDLTDDVLGSSIIARVLPYCPYSKVLAPPAPIIRDSVMFLEDNDTTEQHDDDDDDDDDVSSNDDNNESSSSQPTLESQLLQCHILKEPPPALDTLTPRHHLTTDQLEYELWLAINDFLITTRTPVSPVLLGLVPGRIKWPAQFALKTISQGFINGFPELKGIHHDFVELPSSYPSYRRQRRLSYSAAYLLEAQTTEPSERTTTTGVGGGGGGGDGTGGTGGLRQTLLETPSTQGRLRLVLEQFDVMHSQKWGEFQ